MLVGYARVSTAGHSFHLQLDALRRSGSERVFTDAAGGACDDRRGLAQALSHLRSADRRVVRKLDRLGRTARQVASFAEAQKARGVEFSSVTDGMCCGQRMIAFGSEAG